MTAGPPTGAPMRGPFPRRDCHLINDRPVQLVGTPDGGLDCVVYDWRSGSFVVDRSYFSRTLPGDAADVDVLDADRFDALVAQLRTELLVSMAERLAAATDVPADADARTDVLGLDPAVPPFDALAAEPLLGPGIVVVEPRLLTAPALEARFGRPRRDAGPVPTTVLTFGAGACTITVVVEDRTTAGGVVLLSLVRTG